MTREERDKKICSSYVPGVTSTKELANKFKLTPPSIGSILKQNGIKVKRRSRDFLNEKRNQQICDAYLSGIIDYNKLSKKFKVCKSTIIRVLDKRGIIKVKNQYRYKRIMNLSKYKISFEWLSKFDDLDKFKLLSDRAMSKRRDGNGNKKDCLVSSKEEYKAFILKFYFCPKFNRVYKNWIDSGKMSYLNPSLDHINPSSKGGKNELSNYQFLSIAENRCKGNMTQDEWKHFKRNLDVYFMN